MEYVFESRFGSGNFVSQQRKDENEELSRLGEFLKSCQGNELNLGLLRLFKIFHL
jgi:hypothetical protein